jgi:hypothetical protein
MLCHRAYRHSGIAALILEIPIGPMYDNAVSQALSKLNDHGAKRSCGIVQHRADCAAMTAFIFKHFRQRELLFQPEQEARSRRQPVHFPTEGLFLSRVGRDSNQFPAGLPEMNTKLE